MWVFMEYKKVNGASSEHDAQQYVEAYLRLFNDMENLKFLSFSGLPFTKETVEGWLRDAERAGVQYVTVVEDNVIRALLCTRSNRLENFEIMALVVDAQFRRRHIGAQLLEMAELEAREQAFKHVNMVVFTDNRPMLSLAISKGFKPTKIEYHARYDGEDILCLRKSL